MKSWSILWLFCNSHKILLCCMTTLKLGWKMNKVLSVGGIMMIKTFTKPTGVTRFICISKHLICLQRLWVYFLLVTIFYAKCSIVVWGLIAKNIVGQWINFVDWNILQVHFYHSYESKHFYDSEQYSNSCSYMQTRISVLML